MSEIKHSYSISICLSESSINMQPVQLVKSIRKTASSPIDDYYTYTKNFFPLANSILTTPDYSGLVLLSLISAVELYVRHIVSKCLSICPICMNNAAGETIKLGAKSYYGENIARGISEEESLASAEGIKTFTKSVLNIKIESGSSLDAALKQFDQICQFRHAAVHSRGHLTFNNSKKLGLNQIDSEYQISLSRLDYQTVYAICNNVTRAYNKLLFDRLLTRWLDHCIVVGEWEQDKSNWYALIDAFYSKQDGTLLNVNRYQMYRRIQKIAAKIYIARQLK